MAFNVAALGDYTREHEGELVTSILFKAKTQSVIQEMGNVQTGIKSSEQINQLDTDAVFQTGGTCGFNASGATAFTQRQITVGKIKVHEALCPKDLEAKWTQKGLQLGTPQDMGDFEQMYLEKKADRISSQLETAIWQGDTLSGNVNLNKFDGLLKITDAAVGVVDANAAPYYAGGPLSGGVTAATAINVFDAVFKAIPPEILDRPDVRVFCGWDVFRTWMVALKNANYFHYTGDNANGELTIPGTNIKVIAVNGLNGTDYVWATYMENVFLGTDLMNEEEKVELFWAKEADQLRFMAEWKLGVQFAFPQHVIKFDAA